MAKFFANGSLHFQEGEWRDDSGDIVEIAEVRHGEWRYSKSYYEAEENYCSLCNQLMTTARGVRMNYCPNCGALMDGGNK